MDKLFQKGRLITLALFLCLASALLAGAKDEPAASKSALKMPSGWDDSMLDKISKGQDPRRNIAILPFEGVSKLPHDLSLAFSDMLTTYLSNTGRFNIVERKQLEKIIAEQAFQAGDLVGDKAAELGRIAGADAIICGTITNAASSTIEKMSYRILDVQVQVDARAIDATTGKIITSKQAVGHVQNKIIVTSDGQIVSGDTDVNKAYAEAVRQALKQVTDDIASQFALMGYVVMASEDKIMINLGSGRGVKEGDTFVAFRKGKEIVHPATGKHIGWDKQILAAVRVVSTEKEMSTVEIVQKKNDSVTLQAGDLVIADQ